MVWGVFSYHGQGNLVVLPRNENLNKNTYLVHNATQHMLWNSGYKIAKFTTLKTGQKIPQI